MSRLEAPEPRPLSELGAVREILKLPFHWRGLRRNPTGSGTVLVVPGFMTGDGATWFLRRSLERLGYTVHGWGLGRNGGDVPNLLPAVTERVRILSEREPIHLVGWSLGGYLSREVARDLPDRVHQVITLASPVVGGPKYTAAARFYRERLGVDLDALEQEIAARDEVPLRVPVTALYSPSDAIVCPAACLDRVNPQVEHVPIDCPHAGFGFSPEVLSIVAKRLARPTRT
ncbi:MAG: alpha/beta fold hydrolase [Myxococcota bacterium]